ncbi:GFA family protein [Microbulbifer epialgicus]|uniref:GFA family protein n=1 Tax=Microbulbifer epialgicus TaxID=393907 RepID=A0ABV4P6H2_9GAMM
MMCIKHSGGVMCSEVYRMKAIARCECGALELNVSGAPVVQLTCHCKECQEFSGLDFVEGGFFRKENCHITGNSKSETLQGGTGSQKIHHSCSSCATPLYVQVEALNGAIAIIANRLSPFTFESEAHIWTSQKAEGTIIPAGVHQTAGPPPKDIVQRMIKGVWEQ